MGTKFAVTSTLAATLLAGCGTVEEPVTFKSKQEEACYREVSANLPGDKELRRDSAGRFVEVTIINSQVRDIDTSDAFNQCMINIPGSASLSDIGTLNLTPAQLQVWSTLTDAQKRAALEFIRDGGTFDGYAATL